jgi:NAD(P)-dependent dehydrogenase (short-subunit alcohol dehydrogenase family)
MRYDLSGRVALVTGPARGIGEAVARGLAAGGARLALVGLERGRLEAMAVELGPGHAWFECDVTQQAALDRAVSGTVESLGGIDVVVANAGIGSFGTVAAMPLEAQARVIEVNLVGVLRTVVATLPLVTARRGYYLLVSSAAALVATPGLAAYSASKSGVEQLGNALRLELAGKGVGVGVAHPGWIDTDLVRDARQDLKAFDEIVCRLPAPFQTVTSPRDCAAALVGAIEGRRRKVFVPRSLAVVAALRSVLTSAIAERIFLRGVKTLLPRLEEEAAALGRPFGENSVETGGRTSRRSV